MKSTQSPTCIHCGRDNSQVPLMSFSYQDAVFSICTEHFPVLIHKPAELADNLPDAEKLIPAEHD